MPRNRSGTLAAAKLEPDGVEMTNERAGSGERGAFVAEQFLCEQNRGGRLKAIENQSGDGKRLASCPQDVCRADIARANISDVTLAARRVRTNPNGTDPNR